MRLNKQTALLTKDKRKMDAFDILMIFTVMAICFVGAWYLPVDQCPDEYGRLLLTEWIYRTGMLPTGNELETYIPGWGFSYALRPYLSSIIGAICMRIAAILQPTEQAMMVYARICSILSVTSCCFLSLKSGIYLFGDKWSARLFAAIICFTPQVLFLGMYLNNDSLSLATACLMLYYLCVGRGSHWSVNSCVGLACGISACLLSYYSAYGWILAAFLFCIVSYLHDDKIMCVAGGKRGIFKRMALVTCIVIGLAGWFFIRNALLHEGDFLGLATEQFSRERYVAEGYGTVYPYISMHDEGLSILEFLKINHYQWPRVTAMSFIGVFGYLDIYMPEILYTQYYLYFAVGISIFLWSAIKTKKLDRTLIIMFVSASIITIGLHFYQSYFRDYQPQGRYIITIIIALAYICTSGWKGLEAENTRRESGQRLGVSISQTGLILWGILTIEALAFMKINVMKI